MDMKYINEAGNPVFSYDFKSSDEHMVLYKNCRLLKNLYVISKTYKNNYLVDVKQILLGKEKPIAQIFYMKDDPYTFILDNSITLYGDLVDPNAVYYCSKEFLNY